MSKKDPHMSTMQSEVEAETEDPDMIAKTPQVKYFGYGIHSADGCLLCGGQQNAHG
jgi:hypothetical protein